MQFLITNDYNKYVRENIIKMYKRATAKELQKELKKINYKSKLWQKS